MKGNNYSKVNRNDSFPKKKYEIEEKMSYHRFQSFYYVRFMSCNAIFAQNVLAIVAKFRHRWPVVSIASHYQGLLDIFHFDENVALQQFRWIRMDFMETFFAAKTIAIDTFVAGFRATFLAIFFNWFLRFLWTININYFFVGLFFFQKLVFGV